MAAQLDTVGLSMLKDLMHTNNFALMEVHVGAMIKEAVRVDARARYKIAAAMGRTDKAIGADYHKKSLNTELLETYSRVLGIDFFAQLSKLRSGTTEIVEEAAAVYTTPTEPSTITLEVQVKDGEVIGVNAKKKEAAPGDVMQKILAALEKYGPLADRLEELDEKITTGIEQAVEYSRHLPKE